VVGVAALVSSVWVPDAGDPPQPARNEFLSQLGVPQLPPGSSCL
jgi:hypothetical protein